MCAYINIIVVVIIRASVGDNAYVTVAVAKLLNTNNTQQKLNSNWFVTLSKYIH